MQSPAIPSATSTESLAAVTGAVRVVIVVNKDWYFLSHRLPLARTLQQLGYEVVVVAGATGRQAEVQAAGFKFVAVPFDRGSLNPLDALRSISALREVYRTLQPRIVHHIAVKAYLFGCVAVLSLSPSKRPIIINTITGRGFVFSARTLLAWAVRLALQPLSSLIRRILNPHFIFFNSADIEFFARFGVSARKRSYLVPGSGVDTNRFSPKSSLGGTPSIVFCSRLLWSKGLGELVASSRMLRREGIFHRLIVAGESDNSNPEAIPDGQIREWIACGDIDYRGFVEHPEELFKEIHVAVLPSHGEGLPLFIVEAMASGLPIVVSNIPGCADCVISGENGFTVPVGSVKQLADALRKLLMDSDLRERFGRASRARALELFDQQVISSQISELYTSIDQRN